MTLDTLIKEMNDAAERASDQVFLWRDGLSSDLATHLNSLPDEALLPAIQRLTAECEKRRLQSMNHLLSREKAFCDAMFRMHQWRMVNAPAQDDASSAANDDFEWGDEVGRVTFHNDEAASEFRVATSIVKDGTPDAPVDVPTVFLCLNIAQVDGSHDPLIIGADKEQTKQLRDLLDKAIAKLWP